MTERSYFWDGTTLGDANQAPYSAAEFAFFVSVLAGQNTTSPWQSSSVSMAAYGGTSLLVLLAASPVLVSAGIAVVNGVIYLNDGAPALTIAVPTPATNPRLDRIVLRYVAATQTVRAVRLAGTEAAIPTPPPLTQSAATFEVSLAQVYITTGGVITIRDERLGAVSLAPGVLFRDLQGRVLEEFFDNFSHGYSASIDWLATAVSTGARADNAGVPSAWNITSGATAASSLTLSRGVTTVFPHELAQAPLLFEARVTPLNAAADANTTAVMRLTNSGSTQMIEFGVIGSLGTTTLWLRNTNAGSPTMNTGVAIDTTGAYHTLGIWVPTSVGPVVALYDGVPVAALNANIPTSTTDMRAEFLVANGATATARAMNIDWARLVRGTA